MLAKRIVPCLDVKNGRVVKGTNFVSLRDAGAPVELARRYNEDGADELVFLDITASHEKRDTLKDLIRAVASEIDIPFTVGGGIRIVDDVRTILRSGADKTAFNTAAIETPMDFPPPTARAALLARPRPPVSAAVAMAGTTTATASSITVRRTRTAPC